MKLTHIRITAILPLTMALTACLNEDTVDGPVEMPLTNIATFVGNTPTATFAYYPADSDTQMTLRAGGGATLDTTAVHAGGRVLISYTASDNEGRINLRGVSPINTDTLRGAPGVPERWDTDPVWLTSLWRSGQYIDMRLRLPYSNEPRLFALAVDSSTVSTAVPRLYLCHSLPEGVSADSTFVRTYYASFDIASVWNRAEVTGVEINVANANLTGLKTIRINKPKL